jgi:hypothetical protein
VCAYQNESEAQLSTTTRHGQIRNFNYQSVSVCTINELIEICSVNVRSLHHMTRPGSILRGVQIYLRQVELSKSGTR